jgi:hypothetical protein
MLKNEIENTNIQLKKTRVPVTKGLPKDSVVFFFAKKFDFQPIILSKIPRKHSRHLDNPFYNIK